MAKSRLGRNMAKVQSLVLLCTPDAVVGLHLYKNDLTPFSFFAADRRAVQMGGNCR
jgi:hypothetical protein